MAAFRDQNKKKNAWYASFYYTDWTGKRKKKFKRGFATKREALEFEQEFLKVSTTSMDMTLEQFSEVYFNNKAQELKERTLRNKQYMIKAHIIPYFGRKKMNEITPADLIAWQNEMMKKGYSDCYLRMIQNQLTALFTHAQRVYNLANNPCKRVRRIGKSDAKRLDFWTEEEYRKFISAIAPENKYHVMFEILYWTGCREGEMLALTKSDFDFSKNLMFITKTYYRLNRQDIVTTPKTEESVRTINIPQFLADEIKDFIDRHYSLEDDERLFPVIEEAVQHQLKRSIEKAGVKKIRVHDLRHSHVAYLIHHDVAPMIIKERLGHKDIKITLNTYGHLYPSAQAKVAELLDANNSKGDADAANEES